MYKNVVIIILVFLLCSLCFQNRENVDILIGNMAETKDKVVKGTSYLKESFDRNFNEKKISIDIPSMQIQKEPFSGIEEDTFFKEDNK
tara:strand:- start:1159 stop:1422 length:264 start_codon:yes stop_codon:yes gene_type:complete